MGNIYRNSTTNLIWLGDDDDATDIAYRAISKISKDLFPSAFHSADMFPGAQIPKDRPQVPSTDFLDINDLQAVDQLFERPWFSRIWVVQEAILAPQSVC